MSSLRGIRKGKVKNLALSLGGEAGLGSGLNALVPLIMRRRRREPLGEEPTALASGKPNGSESPS